MAKRDDYPATENRVVGRELERRWEEALQQQRQVEEDYDRFRRQQPGELTRAQREAVLRLSKDVPPIGHADTTTPHDRQEILRLLLDRVVMHVEGESEHVEVTLRWRFHKCVGWVHSREIPVAGGRWAVRAGAEEVSPLRRRRSYRRQWPEPRYPADLTTPKPRVNHA